MPVIVGAWAYSGGSVGAWGALASAGVSSSAPSRTQRVSRSIASGASCAPPIGIRGSNFPVTKLTSVLLLGEPFTSELPCLEPPLRMPS